MSIKIKICGIKRPEDIDACLQAKIDFIGFVFHLASPRFLTIERAQSLLAYNQNRLDIVGVFANQPNKEVIEIAKTLKLDMIQLHGLESIDDVKDIKSKTRCTIIKSFGIKDKKDLALTKNFTPFIDYILLDGKDEGQAAFGKGISFIWQWLRAHPFEKPYFLAGGLTPDNVTTALFDSGAHMVDVSSGVEQRKGQKDPKKIISFAKAAREAYANRPSHPPKTPNP